jgi:phage-related protein
MGIFLRNFLGQFYAVQKKMMDDGPNLGMPYTRAMGEGLFEIRLADKDGIARVFYCTVEKNEIWILHSFIKKTRKTPDKELQLARKRLREVKHRD